jgi:4-hydroxybenzoate polyprenyltransferase
MPVIEQPKFGKVGSDCQVVDGSEAVPSRSSWMLAKVATDLWVELRPLQWLKNLLVLAPLLFSQNLFDPVALTRSLLAFAAFCLISSSVYLLNDLKDRGEDRLHPTKRHRPIASGELGLGLARGTMVALLICALAGGAMLDKTFVMTLVGYWFVNLLYSTWLKHQVILDVFTIATGFLFRVVGGAAAIQVQISDWLLICTTLLALFLAFSKRRHELLLLGEDAVRHRGALSEYSPSFLDMMIGIVTASTLMSYALYTVSEETVRKFNTRGLLMTMPFVLYGICRYLYLVYHKNQGGDPTHNLFTDVPTVINLCLWAVTAAVILYRQ